MVSAIAMTHDKDPATLIHEQLGDIDDVDVFNDRILLAIYERPEKTAGGVLLTQTSRAEDQFQGKAAMIVKMGPIAVLKEDDRGGALNVGDWVAIRPSDGWPVRINKQMCRLVSEKDVHLRLASPDQAW